VVSWGRAKLQGLVLVDPESSLSEMLGLPAGERVSLASLYRTSEGLADLTTALRKLGGQAGAIVTSWCHPDGSVHEVFVRVTDVTPDAPDERFVEVLDVTGVWKSARLGEREETTLSAILDHSPIGFGLLVLDPGGNRVMGWYNRAMGRIFGYDGDEMLGKSSRILYKDDETFRRNGLLMRQRVEEDGLCDFVVQMVRKGGEAIDVRVITVPVRLDNEVSLLTIVEDISQQRQAEREREDLREQLHQSQKLESIGRLAGGVAHDFNNLLTSIFGYTELARADTAGENERAGYLDEIERAAGRAARLTRQLLAFSRKQIMEPRVLDLNELIGEMHKMLVRLIGEDIVLTTENRTRVGRIRADRGQVEQILVNLVVNARDAMPGGGRLTIETKDVVLGDAYCQQHREVRPGEYVMLAVSDTGTGMSPETRARVFEPFFTTKGPGEGSGLGLSTVHGIVKQHEGSVEVYSEPGRGTVLKVYFPLVYEPSQRVGGAVPESTLPQGTESVLVVEDDATVRAVAASALNRLGYHVVEAESGTTALALLAAGETRVDLLLTDVVMPDMNGRQLAEEMAQRVPGIRILFTSGYTENVIGRHGVLEPGIHFISKPYTPGGLARKVREVLDAP